MKAVVIFIVVLFLGIFGVKFYIDNKSERDTKKAEKEYKDYLSDRQAKGDTLDLNSYISELNAKKTKSVMKQKDFVDYLEGDFVFDCRNLEKRSRFEESGSRPMFGKEITQFGPEQLSSWKAYTIPRIATNPSNRMLASKVLRSLDEWSRETENISLAIIDGLGKNNSGLVGLQRIRTLDVENEKAISAEKSASNPAPGRGKKQKGKAKSVVGKDKKVAVAKTVDAVGQSSKTRLPNLKERYFKRIIEYQKAMATIGRLQFYKGSRRKPYDVVEDMLRFSNAVAREAIFKDELELSDDLDSVMVDYIIFLASNGASGKYVAELQKKLVNSPLDTAIFSRVRVKRISTQAELEKKLTGFTKTEVNALSIFDSGLMMTEKEKWEVLKVYTKAGVILNYSGDEGEYAREFFGAEVLNKFGGYVEQSKNDLELVDEATAEFNLALAALEDVVYEVMKKKINRDRAALCLAIASYKLKTGAYPQNLGELTTDDIADMPMHPLTGKMYEYTYNKPPKLKNEAELFPSVKLSLNAQSVIKRLPKKGFKN